MNFVIFMPDEMHGEAAGCYGHPLVKTPNLDRLAAEGTRFEACYAQHPVCTPSRCSMFTGWYPHVGGHRTLWRLLRPHEPNFLRCLKSAGYDVYWYGKNDLLAVDSFPGSVTEAIGPTARNVGPLKRGGPDDRFYDSFLAEPFPGGPWDTGDAQNVRRGFDLIRSRPARPFVLYLPLVLPHPEYSAPMPWHEMYSADDVPSLRPPETGGKPMFHELIRRTRRLERLGDADLRLIHSIYLGTITYVDYLFGEQGSVVADRGWAGSESCRGPADQRGKQTQHGTYDAPAAAGAALSTIDTGHAAAISASGARPAAEMRRRKTVNRKGQDNETDKLDRSPHRVRRHADGGPGCLRSRAHVPPRPRRLHAA